MATLNKSVKFTETTHEGALSARINAEQQLRRSVMACMLWEDTFYESGESIADRISQAILQVKPDKVAAIAIEARTKMKLRHVPLLIVRQMARMATHKHLVAETLAQVIQRPDEITEFLAIYWKDKKEPLSAQVKKGLARAFAKFDEYSLAKYNQDGKVKLRDALFMCHANPKYATNPLLDGEARIVQREYVDKKSGNKVAKALERHDASLYAKLVNKTLQTPDTWEVALSGGADKKEVFERLMSEKKLGALAFIRNLRNMQQAGCDKGKVQLYSETVNIERVLPFRFIAAARHVPQWEPMIESMMLRCLTAQEKLSGKTVIVVDNSGSMYGAQVSKKSEIDRSDAACALAILVREIADDPIILSFSNVTTLVPARRGFALRDAIKNATQHASTDTYTAIRAANSLKPDRVIVITDEQSQTRVSAPDCKKAYFVNVSVEKNGIGYGAWTHIDGWSEAIIDYIRATESIEQ